VSEISELDTSVAALARWKWFILAGAVVCSALSGGYTLLGPPRYSTSTLVEVGRVMGAELEDAFAVAQTVNSPGFQAAARARSGSAPGLVTAEALTGGQGRLEHPTLVRITATASTPSDAVAAGNASVDELVDRHQQRFSAAMVAYLEQEKALVEMGPAGQRDLAELRARMTSPTVTAKTMVKDPFPVPSAPAPRNTAFAAAIGFVLGAAILTLIVVAGAQIGLRAESDLA
jgi:hypothetical protein